MLHFDGEVWIDGLIVINYILYVVVNIGVLNVVVVGEYVMLNWFDGDWIFIDWGLFKDL